MYSDLRLSNADLRKKALERNAEFKIKTLKTTVKSGYAISYIESIDMKRLVESYCTYGTRIPNGLFIAEESDGYTVCEGDYCLCEWFLHERTALRWLIEDYDSVESLLESNYR